MTPSPEERRVITIGQWLGMSNRVSRMELFKYGWKMTDATGATYRQPDFPDGLRTWDEPTDGRTDTPVTPWPFKQ
jgi:hypothetical protein